MTSTFLLFIIDLAYFIKKNVKVMVDGTQINCVCQVNISNRSYIEGHLSVINDDKYGN